MDNVVAVCDFSGDVSRVWQTLWQAPKAVVVAGGVVVESLLSGARGWTAAVPNVFPEEAVRLFDLVESGFLVEAQALRRALGGPLRWEGRPASSR